MDVSALYPSVPQEEGLISLGKALDRRVDQSVSTDYLVRMMKIVLTMNTFEWDQKLYRQIMGTAIGTRAAPTFCGIFMGELEERILSLWESLQAECDPEDWWRFIDDILFWWVGTPGDLLIFINFVNSVHPNIKFTCEFDFQSRSVVFLDLVICVDDDGYIQTDLHTKPNSKNPYLLPESNHPSHVSRNIPYSLAFRIKRNCSVQDQYNIRIVELKEKLRQRGYKRKYVDFAIEKVNKLKREDILDKLGKDMKNEGRVKAVFRFDRRLPELQSIFVKHWKTMVNEDSRMKTVFQEPPMVGFTRGKNIREQLCTAKLPPLRRSLRPQEDGFRRCNLSGCRLCPFTGLCAGEVQRWVRVNSTGEKLPIRGRLNCKSKNILYLITCKKDGRQYAGETGNSAEERFARHRNTVVQACYQGTEISVGQHFQSCGHSVSDLVFPPVEQIFSQNIFVRKVREKKLINQCDLLRRGLNRNL